MEQNGGIYIDTYVKLIQHYFEYVFHSFKFLQSSTESDTKNTITAKINYS